MSIAHETEISRPISKEIYQKLCSVIPKGVNSAARAFPGLEMSPLIAKRGVGEYLIDADDRRYIDFCMGWGALILGHAPAQVIEAISEQLHRGTCFGISTEIEYEIAAKVVSHYPSIEKVRFVNSGTEAVMTAARLARGYTHRPLIVKFDGHYHGHCDTFLVKAGSSALHVANEASSSGVLPQMTLSIPFNNFDLFENLMTERGSEIAAVVVEPIAGNMGVVLPKPGFLEFLRAQTMKHGVLLIFDEVITGYRVGLSGAQGYYGIEPDITTLGKVIGGGFPAAAVGGRAEIMNRLAPEGNVFQAGTLSGNPIAMRAGLETLKIIEKPGFYQELQKKSDFFWRPLERFCVNRIGSMGTLFIGPHQVESLADTTAVDRGKFKRFFHRLFERGVYLPPSPFEAWFIGAAHSFEGLKMAQEIIDETLLDLM